MPLSTFLTAALASTSAASGYVRAPPQDPSQNPVVLAHGTASLSPRVPVINTSYSSGSYGQAVPQRIPTSFGPLTVAPSVPTGIVRARAPDPKGRGGKPKKPKKPKTNGHTSDCVSTAWTSTLTGGNGIPTTTTSRGSACTPLPSQGQAGRGPSNPIAGAYTGFSKAIYGAPAPTPPAAKQHSANVGHNRGTRFS